jgi:hypothetical protein
LSLLVVLCLAAVFWRDAGVRLAQGVLG